MAGEPAAGAGLSPADASNEFWVFGFGSLIWHPGFEFSRRVEGHVKGFRRVFHQGSTDHRGVPEAPGRTVTLEPCPGGAVWGAAYLLAGTHEQQQATLKYLEWREKQYDVRLRLPVFGKDSSEEPLLPSAVVYIASSDTNSNQNWLGPAPLEEIALQIATARGPSGPNDEYLFQLTLAVRQMGQVDEELEWLTARVQDIAALCTQN